jgi:NMD protein affecting ribosome stability and mRNA decay
VVCVQCHAIWQRKRWHLDEAAYPQLLRDPAVEQGLCPGCRQIAQQMFDGEVFIESPLVQTDGEAIVNLLRHTEARLRQNNPLARLASVETREERIHVLTITPFLAERLGKELQKAYGGHLVVEHAERERFTRVFWSRDAHAPFR